MSTRCAPPISVPPRWPVLLRVACGLALAVVARPAAAQKRVVLYVSHSAVVSPEVTYRLPGDEATRRRGGLGYGDRLTVPSGSQVCFVVERANPLLYSYTAAAKTIAVSPPAGLDEILAGVSQFSELMVGAAPREKAAIAQQQKEREALRRNAAKLSAVEEAVGDLEQLKTDSDLRDDFAAVFREATRERNDAFVILRAATALHDSIAPTLPIGDQDLLAQLRRYQSPFHNWVAWC